MPLSPTLLIIDDDRAICAMLAEIARNLGYVVDTASTAGEIELIIATPHDVVMLDLSLGDTDGMVVMRSLANHHPGARLVLLTGADVSVLSGARRVAEMSGFHVLGAFAKPAPIVELEALLRDEAPAVEPVAAGPSPQLQHTVLQALDRGQMFMLYQPIVEFASGAIIGAEALVRLALDGSDTISPAVWVPIIEASGRTRDLLDVVFRLVSHDRRQVPALQSLQNISLNLSLLDLADLHLPERAATALSDTAPPHAWTLELTETAEIGTLHDALDVLVRLRLKGFLLAMDDFGTGASTLDRLREMPLTSLKADRRFIRTDFKDREHSVSMLRAAVELGAALGLRVVAEGIETAEELELARSVGCDFGQGYFIGRPVRAEAFGVLVASWLVQNSDI